MTENTATGNGREFGSNESIRARLHSGGTSSFQRYRQLILGDGSLVRLLWYEFLMLTIGPLPGALGLVLRKTFFPSLFRRCGKGVVFGRSVVIRNPQNIELEDGVLIDDYCLLDGRGGDEESLVVGERTILNRGVVVQAKIGTIRIGADSDIGAGTCIVSQGGVFLGKGVSVGGNSCIGGGLLATERAAEPEGASEGEGTGPSKPRKFTKGPVRLGDRTSTGMNVLILDGVETGSDCIIGAGSIVRESVPEETVVTPHQRLILLRRQSENSGDEG